MASNLVSPHLVIGITLYIMILHFTEDENLYDKWKAWCDHQTTLFLLIHFASGIFSLYCNDLRLRFFVTSVVLMFFDQKLMLFTISGPYSQSLSSNL